MKITENLKLNYLKEICSDSSSCVQKISSKYTLLLHPQHLTNIKEGVRNELNSMMKAYIKEFDGVLLGYENVKITIPNGHLFDTNPFVHISLFADFYIFAPIIGNHLQGTVVKKSPNHIGCLIHGIFNASALFPRGVSKHEWCGKNVNEGDVIQLEITHADLKNHVPYLRGDIIPESVSKTSLDGAPGLSNSCVTFDEDDSGISSVDKSFEDEVLEKKSKKKKLLNQNEDGGKVAVKKKKKKLLNKRDDQESTNESDESTQRVLEEQESESEAEDTPAQIRVKKEKVSSEEENNAKEEKELLTKSSKISDQTKIDKEETPKKKSKKKLINQNNAEEKVVVAQRKKKKLLQKRLDPESTDESDESTQRIMAENTPAQIRVKKEKLSSEEENNAKEEKVLKRKSSQFMIQTRIDDVLKAAAKPISATEEAKNVKKRKSIVSSEVAVKRQSLASDASVSLRKIKQENGANESISKKRKRTMEEEDFQVISSTKKRKKK